jgi:hypothetical protein
MEIVKSRYGLDRSIEKLNHNTMRVMGDSQFVRTSNSKNGEVNMFDFEGGPCLTVGGKIQFQKINWKITEIHTDISTYKGLSGCVIKVVPVY